MKILVISFDVGVTSSGISTDRVCRQLVQDGHQVQVLAGKYAGSGCPYLIRVASPEPLKPARLFKLVGDLIGRDLNYMFWEERAVKAGKLMMEGWIPDVIYARGSPGCAFTVGHSLALSSGVPLALHFADPIPATPDWQPSPRARLKHLRTILPAQQAAELITVVNRRMLDYQQATTSQNLLDRALTLPNPIPEALPIGPMPENGFVFSFLGSFFGSRSPDSLLAAFSSVVAQHPSAALHIYGVWPKRAARMVMENPALRGRVVFMGWTRDIAAAISRSSCLIDVDADAVHSVYTSNKLMEYLSTDRPILLISPNGSASRELVTNLRASCRIVGHDVDEIRLAMVSIIEKSWSASDFAERDSLRKSLSLEVVCRALEASFAALADRPSELAAGDEVAR